MFSYGQCNWWMVTFFLGPSHTSAITTQRYVELPGDVFLGSSVLANYLFSTQDVSYQSSVVMTLEDSDEFENSSLSPPKQVCKSSLSKKQYSPMLGVCCEIGHASDWMYQSSSGIQSDLSMGQVPGSSFGCVLSAGQSSRKFRRAAPGGLDPSYFATDFLDYEVNCPSDFMMKPPSFVCSLYSLLLEVAYLRVNLDASALSSNMYHDKTSRLTVSNTKGQ